MTAIYSENTRVLKEMIGVSHFGEAPPETKLSRVMIIDTETTGLDRTTAEIIELGFHLVEFDSSGNMYKILYTYNGKQEPSEPLPEEIKQLTGFTDDDLKGQQIDWGIVEKVLSKTDVVLAYNSYYDRPVLERYCKAFENKYWVCAYKEFDWLGMYGMMGSQEFLFQNICLSYYSAHNTTDDINALALLLNETPPNSNNKILYHVISNSAKKFYNIYAVGAKYEQKDDLKENGFKWDGDLKLWYIRTEETHPITSYLDSKRIEYQIKELNGFNRYRL